MQVGGAEGRSSGGADETLNGPEAGILDTVCSRIRGNGLQCGNVREDGDNSEEEEIHLERMKRCREGELEYYKTVNTVLSKSVFCRRFEKKVERFRMIHKGKVRRCECEEGAFWVRW